MLPLKLSQVSPISPLEKPFVVELAVRLRPSFVLIIVLASQPTQAMTFQTRLEKVEWAVEGDKFECRLSQPVSLLGSGEFVRRAGERPTFRLRVKEQVLGQGSATLLAAAAPWQPGKGDINLGRVTVGSGEIPFNSSQEQGARLMSAMLEGRSPLVRHQALGGETLEVRLLPVRFNKAYEDYLGCTAKLLPVNYDQVRRTEVGFPGGGVDLEEAAKARLDVILDFIAEDPSINRIFLDGHSDNSGNRLINRDLSRRRALAVAEYLKAKGFAEEQITVRFHGESYPKVANSNQANRALNRRVTIRLEREPLLETATDAQSGAAQAAIKHPS